MKQERLRILHLEDDPMDAELVLLTLTSEGLDCEVQVVSRRDEFSVALERGGMDLILADFALPAFDGMTALAMVRQKLPDLPFVFVSGKLGEEAAIESLKSGATDYVLKSRLSRLVPAVQRALTEAQERAKQRQTERDLEVAHAEIEKRAEDYRNLFNSIRDVIVVADHNRTILHVNQPALHDIFGYDSPEVIGKSSRILYAKDDDYDSTGKEVFDAKTRVKGKLVELHFRRRSGEVFIGELYAMKRLDRFGNVTGNISIFRDISERKKAEADLRESELRRMQLQLELVYAAEIQAKLLPRVYPQITNFEIAARCLPAKQVGGDYYDWQQVSPTLFNLTLGDVMGKGMAAAMLMATVRAALHAVTLYNPPAQAVHLAENSLNEDLENSESFVTLFHAQLDSASRTLSFVDCGHGYVFVRRANGAVETLNPRGLPLGIQSDEVYQEGAVQFGKGDVMVLYSDGLVDAKPELELTHEKLARKLSGKKSAQEMADTLIALIGKPDPQPDDITVLVLHAV
ncbi:SpoIIE family protein phosphatase [Geomonas sp. Red69]|uniref:SpoIIE family protein phosphatase n=1 Tax=Geomonas diazotrophica TaxID=2843197 RepID=A0ABX8JMF8_9BACT|nr:MULTISPECIES: SpoIIE family protein phosphatase [Geomonas]MBU5638820.1 SpoIIE family protein phosphatase [Geomonas diazotrophica]QWV96615.1 SpoIIE family protein phosphatase [Geomonas nitrogeniifigens]QXE85717.1 SpoIIE family protein phosphatase [Geomonas nitrogeniifigens]